MEIIVAVDENFAIGYKNDLLARISPDLRRFKQFTVGNAIVCGKNTYLSFPKHPMPDRDNIIITHNPSDFPEAICFDNLDECITYCKSLNKKCFVCGGGVVYKDLLPYCHTAHVTKIIHKFENADTYFPNLDKMADWKITEQSEIMTHKDLKFMYVTYQRI